MRVGLTLPHFSDECTWERLLGFAPEIERLGFDSVWVRDHISFEQGALDPPGRRFIDPFVTLAAIAGATTRLKLGFAVMIPLRHPLVSTQLVGSLDWVSRGRVELGIGIGGPSRQFDAVGIAYKDRVLLCEDTLQVMARSGDATPFGYESRLTSFTDVLIDPPPPPQLPMWYGGYSTPALRRATRLCTGIMPSRTTFAALDPAMRELAELAEQAGRHIDVGSAPALTLGRDRADAIRAVDQHLDKMISSAKLDRSAVSSDLHELDGALIAGNAAQCVEQLAAFEDRGIESVVLDLRMRMDSFEDIVREIATDVLAVPSSGPSR